MPARSAVLGRNVQSGRRGAGRSSGELRAQDLGTSYAALGDFARAVGRVDYLDTMIAKTTGEYGSAQLPEEAAESLRMANRALSDAKGLILDDKLREAVATAQATANCLRDARS